MIKRIAHVCLHVKDLKRSLEYYEKLGFRLKFKFTKNGAFFGAYMEIAEGNYIEMFENKSLDKPVNTGIVHFCLETEDLDGFMAMLKKQGIPFTPKTLGCDNTYQIWLSDPDGNPFEIHAYTVESAQFSGQSVEADW
jgi:lactoylglutathione lyase